METANSSVRIVASGLLAGSGGQGLDLIAYAANVTTTTGNTGLDIIHSSPNAPTVGVVARGVATLVSSFSFATQAAFISVPSNSYTLDVNAGSASGATVGSYTAPLAGFIGQNIAVLATGTFPGTFGLIAVASSGAVVQLPVFVTSISNEIFANSINIYPNPTSGVLSIGGSIDNLTISISDLSGKKVITSKSKMVDLSGLPSGIYIATIANEEGALAFKKIIKE